MNNGELSEEEKLYFKTLLEKNAAEFKASNGTVEEFQKYLGNTIKTPLGTVRMGANQYSKFIAKNRGDLFIAARETLENPVLVFTADNGSKVYAKSFVSEDGRKKNVISATILRDGIGIVITTHEERMNQILGKIKKTGILYQKAPGL